MIDINIADWFRILCDRLIGVIERMIFFIYVAPWLNGKILVFPFLCKSFGQLLLTFSSESF